MPPTDTARPTKIYFAAAALAGVGLVAYHNSLGGPFIFDDPSSIVSNPTIRSLWPPWAPLSPPNAPITVQGRPVLNFSFALNYAISGRDVGCYHALNLAIHLFAGLALFGIVRRTLLRTRFAVDALPLAFVIAGLWIVHPLQTESVTYTVQRAESLMGLWYLLTLYFFVRAAEANDARSGLVASGVVCALGMATKEVMVSAPIVVWLYDRAFVAGTFRDALRRRKRFYAGLAVTWIVLAWCVASNGGQRGGSAGFGVGVDWWDYELTQFRAIAHYLRLAFWPAPLVFEYGSFWIDHVGEVLPEMLWVLGLAAGTLVAVWKKPAWGFLGCWFFASLSVTSLVPGTTQMIVEHRMYLPLAAVIVALVLGLHAWLGRRGAWIWLLPALGLIAVTVRRNEDYRTEITIWSDTVAKRPGNGLAHEMLGQALDRAKRYDLAAVQHEAALKIYPGFPVAHVSLGDDLARNGKLAEAIAHYEAALQIKPDYVDAHHELGIALFCVGRHQEAVAQHETTLRLKPEFADAHFDLANVLGALGRAGEAATHYQTALTLRPDYPAAHFNFANLLADSGKPAEALPHYQAAIAQRPNYPEAFNNLGGALLDLGRTSEAIAAYEAALKLRPDFRDARENLARIRAAVK